jgi:hypothetical protein
MDADGLGPEHVQIEASIGHGQTLYVTGDAPALGENDPNNGVPLFTSPTDYPRWTSDVGE